ncbi:hypothetical protein ACRYCC_28110 [Actinomadura scrupuli]|uniref:hypothetical protein n=1 Tax=Actinomadura scrupuli TaxID=559629 RepID=UPI003D97D71D
MGAGLTLVEGSSKLFGRSIFKNYLLDSIAMSALVVTTAEYGIGAAVLLLVAYRLQILGLVRHTEPRPQRLRLTWQAVTAIAVLGGCNLMGRGLMALAMTSGTALATINAITFAVSTMTYSKEVWQTGQRFAAMLVPLLIVLGLAVSIEAWHITVRPWGVIWSIGSALSGIIYMALSRSYVDRGGADADQFQALSTSLGVVGLAVWAKLAGEDPSVGWSWEVLLALLCTALMTVVVPRYLHVRARRALGDAVYTILWSVIPLLGLLVDLIMEQKIPTIWQVVGMSWISVIAAGASLLRLPPEARATQRRKFRRAVKRLKKLFGCGSAYG